MNKIMTTVKAFIPGILVLVALTLLSTVLASFIGEDLMGFSKSPVSAVTVAVIIGMLLGNLIKMPVIFDKGIQFGSKKILRYGIILLGLRLGLGQIGQVALSVLPVILVCVLVGLFLPHLFNRWFKLPGQLVTLISVGTSICGISAIVATSESISVKKEYTAYAIATITIFGLLSMMVYPFLAHAVFEADSLFAGLFLGTAIHDTSQVTGAAFMYQDYYHDEAVVQVATIAKLMRNTLMVFVIPGLTLVSRRQETAQVKQEGKKPALKTLFPFFMLGFLAMAALRTIGDHFITVQTGNLYRTYQQAITFLLELSSFFITMALASVGLKTSIKVFKGLGLKPLAVGLLTAVLVGVTSIAMIFLLLD
jgi:uncharacterized integral membrane protein (TIGR00698 family)